MIPTRSSQPASHAYIANINIVLSTNINHNNILFGNTTQVSHEETSSIISIHTYKDDELSTAHTSPIKCPQQIQGLSASTITQRQHYLQKL